MELSEFITLSLLGIQKGVHDAISSLKNQEISGVINPVWGDVNNIDEKNIQTVTFDVLVTTDARDGKSNNKAVNAGITALGGALHIVSNSESTNTKSHRIQFSIPFVPAMTIVTKET